MLLPKQRTSQTPTEVEEGELVATKKRADGSNEAGIPGPVVPTDPKKVVPDASTRFCSSTISFEGSTVSAFFCSVVDGSFMDIYGALADRSGFEIRPDPTPPPTHFRRSWTTSAGTSLASWRSSRTSPVPPRCGTGPGVSMASIRIRSASGIETESLGRRKHL